MLSLDLTDQLARFPIAYNYQPVKGWAVKHEEITLAQSIQRIKQNALGDGTWDGVERLWADAFEILPADYQFHAGTETDEADAFFPSEEPHPWTSWISAKTPAGISADQAEKLFGIYRTLRTANYDGAGVQIDINGNPIGGGDPRNYYFFYPNPANCAVDQLTRWGQREASLINYPAFVDWRDYNDELVNWDDSRYTPRNLSLTGTTGGSLTPGNTYYTRVVTVKGADVSSASLQTIETAASSITLSGGQTAFQVNWLLKDTITDHTGFRVYIGTTPGVWVGYFTVSNPALRALVITTTAGATAGDPPSTCTAGLMRQIKRFECGLFFVPPYDLATALDRICQVSCADWQWSGLGTSTYRNDKVRFLSPATRTPVFTLDLSQTAPGSFKTWAIDRRNRYNQIIGNFRDRDDEFLADGAPVVMNREQMQIDDKQVKTFTIEFGTAYRSQVQRAVSFWARMLCDMDQAASLKGSPETYPVLPADVVEVTNETPDWTDVQFLVTKKQENVETNIGDPLSLRLYSPGMYSDDDWTPLPRNLPASRFDPLSAPPVASNLVLTSDDTFITGIIGDFDFGAYAAQQIARVFLKGPSDTEPDDSTYRMVASVPSDGGSTGHFEIRAINGGQYWVKVATESALGVSLASGHPVATINLRPAAVTDVYVAVDGSSDWMSQFIGHPRSAELPALYAVQIYTDQTFTVLKRTLPVTAGTTHASLLHGSTVSGGLTVDDNGNHVQITSPHTDKNNLYSPFTGSGKAKAITLDSIVDTFCRYDFTIQWLGSNGGLIEIPFGTTSGMVAQVGLQPLASPSNLADINFDLCPIWVEWTGNANGRITETYRSFTNVIGTRSKVDPGFFINATNNRNGPRYTFLLSGTEYRAYVDYKPAGGNTPLAITASPSSGFPFPLRLVMRVGGFVSSMGIKNIIGAGNWSPITVYAGRDQIADFGTVQTRVFQKIFQQTNLEGVEGAPTYVIVPPL